MDIASTKYRCTRFGGTARAVLLALLLVSLLQPLSGADATSLCNAMLSGSVLSVAGGSANNPFNSIMATSLLIMLMMANIAAFTFILGYAFKVDRLTRFGKAEIGEIIITVIIVLLTIGTFQPVIFGSPTYLPAGNFIAVANGNAGGPGVFTGDCIAMMNTVYTSILNFPGLIVLQDTVSILSSFTFTTGYAGINFEVQPPAGLSMQAIVIGKLMSIDFALLGLPIAVAFVLAIIYQLFPLFLYAGIILRTLPWTRAAGGAFLGLFIAFYIMFPIALNALISGVSAASVSVGCGTSCSITNNPIVNSFASFAFKFITAPSATLLGFNLIGSFIQADIAEMFYIIVAVVIAFIISYDFMEFLGDLLGAPSLRSSQTLKKLI